MNMRRSKKLIHIEEYVRINDIDQYLLHSGSDMGNPVMLFLHGGPGNAESLFEYTMEEWEDIYTVVHWDQRGAGKTYIRNPQSYPTVDIMLQDLYEVVKYLKKKYNKQKIVIFGHSWGSVLGSIFVRRYPEEVAYYIGVGQVISMNENERIGYEKLKKLIIEAGDNRSLKKLETVGEYPGERIVLNSEFLKKCTLVRKLQGKYGLGLNLGLAIWITALRSPIFKFSDLKALKESSKANKNVLEEFLGSYDLRMEPADYEVPLYYILGENDWQTPYIIAKDYLDGVNAPRKKLFLIPNASHFTMFDQPKLFCDSLIEIYQLESGKQGTVN